MISDIDWNAAVVIVFLSELPVMVFSDYRESPV